jgi:hypothetical protein
MVIKSDHESIKMEHEVESCHDEITTSYYTRML